jgi:hypothetical protein
MPSFESLVEAQPLVNVARHRVLTFGLEAVVAGSARRSDVFCGHWLTSPWRPTGRVSIIGRRASTEFVCSPFLLELTSVRHLQCPAVSGSLQTQRDAPKGELAKINYPLLRRWLVLSPWSPHARSSCGDELSPGGGSAGDDQPRLRGRQSPGSRQVRRRQPAANGPIVGPLTAEPSSSG